MAHDKVGVRRTELRVVWNAVCFSNEAVLDACSTFVAGTIWFQIGRRRNSVVNFILDG